MRKIIAALGVLGAFAALTLPASPAQAQVWVSGDGSDANGCFSPATPCRSLTEALAKTENKGTINVLPGLYGAFTIDKSVEIIADGGQALIWSGVSIPGGGNAGIVVNAGAGDVVRIRGVTVNELGNNYAGIAFVAGGALHLENCTLVEANGIRPGLYFVPGTAASGGAPTELTVRNSTMGRNSPGNVLIKPSNGVAVAALFDNVLMVEGTYGIKADNSGGSGRIRVDVRNSVAKGNVNNGFLAVGTGANPVHFMIDRSTADNNGAFGAVATGAQAFMIV
ncbi:MAG: hypothetical protein ACXW50_17645, partial [Candidatus Binatia bacterium]